MQTSFWTKLFDLFSPRLCVGCGHRLSPNEPVMCCSCMLGLPLTHFSVSPHDNVMARMFWGLFPLEKAVALCYYEPNTEFSRVIHAVKYFGRQDVGVHLGEQLARTLQETDFFSDIDAIVPVPLSTKRQKERGYNQSMLIAEGVSNVTGITVFDGVLERTEFAVSQTHLNIYERRENVDKAFRLRDEQGITGKHLLLVDDVMTTGATLTSCARQLLTIDGVRISIATLGFTKY